MPRSKTFFLDEQRTQIINITWDGGYRNVQVTHNGHALAVFPDKTSLKQGGSFTLLDGSRLDVYLKTERLGTGLCVDHNGKPIKGSFNHPDSMLGSAAGAAGFAGLFNAVVAIIGVVSGFGIAEVQQYWWVFAATGALLVISGICIPYTKLLVMVHATIFFLALNIAWLFYFSVLTNGRYSLFGAVLNVLMIFAVSRAYIAIRMLNTPEQN